MKFDQYRRAFSTGVNAAGRRADVINGSWGSDEISEWIGHDSYRPRWVRQ